MSAVGTRNWKALPAVTVVSGDHEFLRHREVDAATAAAKAAGRRVTYLAAGDSAGLQELFSGGFLFSEATFAVVESASSKKRASKGDGEESSAWTDEDVELVVAHAKEKRGDTAVLVHHALAAGPKTFAAKVAAGIPKQGHIAFTAPKPWEAKAYATKFLLAEVGRLGKSIGEPLAEAVVTLAGSDLGPLSFEALKMSLLLDARGRTEVQREDLVGLVASFGSEDFQVLKDALAGRNVKGVIKSVGEIRNGPSGDAAMRTCLILSTTVTQWLHAAALVEQGLGKDEAASRMRLNPYVYEKNVLPVMRRWKKGDLSALLRGIAAVETGVRKGHAEPWVELESTLVLACQG